MTTRICSASLVALLAAAPAAAQSSNGAEQGSQTDGVTVLSQWSYAPLYEYGWSVEQVFDETELIGEDGEDIGDVENIVFRDDGTLLAIIAEVGGFWDIGDTHVSVPWGEATLAPDNSTLTVPVNEENVGEYSVFGDGWFDGEETITEEGATDEVAEVDSDLEAGSGVFKATDLIGDYVGLNDEPRYGYVNDIIVQDGSISAVVIDAAAFGRTGYYAYPYERGRGMDPYGPRYSLPYGAEEVESLESFDYDSLTRGGS